MRAETLDEKTTRLAHIIAYGSHERQKRIIGEIIEEERARACRIINEYSNNTPDLAVAQMAHDLIKAIAMGDDAAPASAAEPAYWFRINSSGKATFWEVEVPDGIPLYKRATAPNGARARNDCLEEAARICEALATSVMHPNQTITDRCAAAIRAAKGDNWHD